MSKGLLMVYTGDVKGGTAAVLGQAFRALGRGLRVCIINFAPGMPLCQHLVWPNRSHGLLKVYDLNEHAAPDCRESGKSGDAGLGLRLVKDALTSGRYDMVVLNDIAVLTNQATGEECEVTNILRSRPEGLHVLVTGQDVPDEIFAAADLVTGASASACFTE